jgi:hypothetical protein
MALAASGGNELLDLCTRYDRGLWPLQVLTYGSTARRSTTQSRSSDVGAKP